jgi:hypothetical protein
MKNSFWMFFILLLIITVTSSLGGGIRYRENFLEEVFDVNDALDSVVDNLSDFPKYFFPETNQPITEEEVKTPQVDAPKITKPIIKESDMAHVLNMPPPPPNKIVAPTKKTVAPSKKTVAFDESATQVVNPVEPKGNFDTLIEGFSGDMYARPL